MGTPLSGASPTLRLLHPFAVVFALTACNGETPTDVRPAVAAASAGTAKVSVCHRPQGSASIIEVATPALRAHLAHGDYVTSLNVSHANSADGSDGIHFGRITDALDAARGERMARGELTTAACRITIDVDAGTYHGTVDVPGGDQEQFPLVVDFPDITLRGAMQMEIDESGRPTNTAINGLESVLAPVATLPVLGGASTPLVIANGHPNGPAGHGLVVEGFVFTSGPTPQLETGGQGVLSIRVNDLVVRRNRFEAGFTESIDLRASTGDVIQNHLSGTSGSCDMCLAAPGRYRAIGNRLLAGGIPGITTSAVVGLPLPAVVEPYVLPAAAEVWSEVRNNEVRNHLRVPVGAGIRVETMGTSASNVVNTVHSVIQDNLLVNNRFGILVHAGFPVNGSPLVGHADVTLGGNVIEQSCQAKLLITFSRHQRTLGLNLALPYLQNSAYNLTLNGNIPLDDVWFDHPAGRGNTFTVDGQPMANGVRQFYSGTDCPGL